VGKPRYLQFDTVDDRREIHQLLRRLSPSRRIAFLEWCCEAATLPNSTIHPKVSRATRELAEAARWEDGADSRLSLAVYTDVWMLAAQYRFSIDDALRRLVEMVRRKAS
jgi:hypothetical protein